MTSYFYIPYPCDEKVRNYPTSKVRLGILEELHFAGAAVERYPTPTVRETQVRW